MMAPSVKWTWQYAVVVLGSSFLLTLGLFVFLLRFSVLEALGYIAGGLALIVFLGIIFSLLLSRDASETKATYRKSQKGKVDLGGWLLFILTVTVITGSLKYAGLPTWASLVLSIFVVIGAEAGALVLLIWDLRLVSKSPWFIEQKKERKV